MNDEETAAALMRRARALGESGRTDEEIDLYDNIVGRFGYVRGAEVAVQVAAALFNKGRRFSDLQHYDRAVVAYGEVVRRYGDRTELSLQERVATALINKGSDLQMLGRVDEALAAYEEVIRLIGNRTEPELVVDVAEALVNKGTALPYDDAIPFFDELIERFDEGPELLRHAITMALFNKARTLELVGRYPDALTVYDAMLGRASGKTEPDFLLLVALGLQNKGAVLAAMNRTSEAIAAYDEMLVRFAAARDGVLANVVNQARDARHRLMNPGQGLRPASDL